MNLFISIIIIIIIIISSIIIIHLTASHSLLN